MISYVFSEDLPKKVVEIPLDRIEPNPCQPRRFFDLEALSGLAASIDEYGVIQPITVKKKNNGGYMIIAGERRYRASCMAKKRTIPAIVVSISEEEGAAIALLENLQRKDLTFFEEAEGYARLMSEYNMTQEELSEKLGKSQSAIANKLRLLKLDEETKSMIFEYGLTERHARALLKLPNKKIRENALRVIYERKLNVAETESYVEKIAAQSAENRRFDSFKATMTEAAKRQRVFCSTINKAIRLLNKSGIETIISQSEDDASFEYVIRIAK